MIYERPDIFALLQFACFDFLFRRLIFFSKKWAGPLASAEYGRITKEKVMLMIEMMIPLERIYALFGASAVLGTMTQY